jgi:hypothetical protein
MARLRFTQTTYYRYLSTFIVPLRRATALDRGAGICETPASFLAPFSGNDAMFRFTFFRATLTWLGRGLTIMAAVACLALAGCKGVAPDSPKSADSSNPSFRPDPAFDAVGRSRKPDTSTGFSGLSDKSRDIERDMGIR